MVLEFLSRIFGSSDGSSEEPIDPETERLAERAESEEVTPELLGRSADRSVEPPVTYLDDDEQPEFLFRGGRLLLADADDSVSEQYPSQELLVVISDSRVLFLIGGRLSDNLIEVPIEDVLEVYVDEMPNRDHLILEANRENELMTFFADITLHWNLDDVRDGVEFIERERERKRSRTEQSSSDETSSNDGRTDKP